MLALEARPAVEWAMTGTDELGLVSEGFAHVPPPGAACWRLDGRGEG
jgi:hypothetical protein